MKAFIQIMEQIAQIGAVVNRNEDLATIISSLRTITQELLGFRCER